MLRSWLGTVPVYEATSVVYVSPNFPATLKVSEEQEYPYDSYIEEQVHSVASYNVLTDALRKLKPGVWQFPGESLESAVGSTAAQLNGEARRPELPGADQPRRY